MQAVILAAGRGTRLKELTSSRSKAMMPIAGKPMIARVIEMLIRGGLSEFIIVAHPEDGVVLAAHTVWGGQTSSDQRRVVSLEREGHVSSVPPDFRVQLAE